MGPKGPNEWRIAEDVGAGTWKAPNRPINTRASRWSTRRKCRNCAVIISSTVSAQILSKFEMAAPDQCCVDSRVLRANDLDEISRHHVAVTVSSLVDSGCKSDGPFRVTLSIGGMTCSTCSGTITNMVSDLPGVSEVAVSFLGKSATVVVDHEQRVEVVVETVEGCGFEVEVMGVESLKALDPGLTTDFRMLTLRIDGMFCQ